MESTVFQLLHTSRTQQPLGATHYSTLPRATITKAKKQLDNAPVSLQFSGKLEENGPWVPSMS
jgi:hypothetical protein